MIKVGDLVTRRSDDSKIVFRVASIDRNNVQLKGKVIRLLCASQLDDLQPYSNTEEETLALPPLTETRKGNFIKGKVLHLDGDEVYLKKAMSAYRSYDVKAIGYFLPEKRMPEVIESLLVKHHPDILVVTGHDALENDSGDRYDIRNYRNSEAFVNTCLAARRYKADLDSLVIIAGACQSYYEALIESGANFASSPKRENIHLLDPVILASELSVAPVYEYVKVERLLSMTINKNMGGLDTKGQARRIYLGGYSTNDT